MNSLFYPKLALQNLKKNSKTYFPYILTCICTVIMYYIMYALSLNKGLDHMSGGAQLKMVLSMGNVVIAIFSIVFLFYTNSFLMKRRKKEFGLFNILGMEKRHLSKIILFETLYVAGISLVVGLIGGMILSKLMFLVLLRILDYTVTLGFEISRKAMIATLILFGIIFFLTLCNSIRQIHLSKPIELIKGSQTGEKEPKTKWLLTILGIIALGTGYVIAITTKQPIQALQMFFFAVVLVIVGTYCLFTAGSIAILKLLRKNKSYYYKTKHFISVSGMMYRMKQNAVGLANICILSTMVLVMISTTVSLYLGSEDVLRTRFPRNIVVSTADFSQETRNTVKDEVKKVVEKHNLTEENILDLRYLDLVLIQDGTKFDMDKNKLKTMDQNTSDLRNIMMIPAQDYNRMMDKSISLKKDEILIYHKNNYDNFAEDTLSILGKSFVVKGRLDSFPGEEANSMDVIGSFYIVVKDMAILEEFKNIQKQITPNKDQIGKSYFGFDLKADSKECVAVTKDIRNVLQTVSKNSYIESAAESRESFYSIYGGLFFLGIFLGILFMMATILIIYYKQISEGYEDKERFEIMQKVGMSLAEIKKTIHSQVLNVFFLPLVTAFVHIAFAFGVITKLLAVLNLTNVTLFALCTVGTALIFALFYGIVYMVTAKEYYKIVRS